MSGAFTRRHKNAVYVALLAASFAVALLASWTALGAQIDNDAYDWMFRLYKPQPWTPQSILLAIDEPSLSAFGGMRGIRVPLADALERITAASPKAVAIDVILSDEGEAAPDARLESALRGTPNLVLSCDLLPDGSWEDPLPRFARWAAGIGHVHAAPDVLDSMSRAIPLEKASARVRRWALALEAFRVSRRAVILESPDDLQVGDVVIPTRRADGRLMRVRYIPPDLPPIPRISVRQLDADPGLAARFSGKVVFVGVTAQTAMRDRLMTPVSYEQMMPGVEIHANAFETMNQGLFLTDAPAWLEVLLSALFVVAAGFTIARIPGWQANVLAAVILLAAHVTPYAFFTHRIVFSFAAPVSAAWLSIVVASAWEHLVVRRDLRKAEADRARYRQTIHFVTHEMRTPLTAIQGSSELMSRYALSEDKRKQIAEMINSESKRLGRMINMFLNVERLSAGQIEIKRELFALSELAAICVERARPLAERKQIRITMEAVPEDSMAGDRELMEYALYNLLTNAVKYSPQATEVTVSGRREGARFRISVRDQGIGMDQKEVHKIFQKFYRTKKAEESGEVGTGIGLSIVQEIITQHGGTIEVTSRPGEGSCFTLVLPAAAAANVAEQH
ncbi:MAG: CHASE2 and HATPase_c domain-containing protein [Acidobacteria bacterium]|nr:CHASE2 and HATPase_c domain-containing protein [Acidobacteriota bacterium]